MVTRAITNQKYMDHMKKMSTIICKISAHSFKGFYHSLSSPTILKRTKLTTASPWKLIFQVLKSLLRFYYNWTCFTI